MTKLATDGTFGEYLDQLAEHYDAQRREQEARYRALPLFGRLIFRFLLWVWRVPFPFK